MPKVCFPQDLNEDAISIILQEHFNDSGLKVSINHFYAKLYKLCNAKLYLLTTPEINSLKTVTGGGWDSFIGTS